MAVKTGLYGRLFTAEIRDLDNGVGETGLQSASEGKWRD
jgi:hypothetical protein